MNGNEFQSEAAKHTRHGRDQEGAPEPRTTLLLDRATIGALMTPQAYFEAAKDAFLAEADGRTQVPVPWHLKAQAGSFHGKGAWVRDRNGRAFVCLKLNANFPANPAQGLPTIQGAVLLCDAHDGRLLAIMDSIEVTLRRTAAATALAVQHLAPKTPWRVLLIGCGAQAPAQMDALLALGDIESAALYDQDPAAAGRLACRCQGQFPLHVVEAGLIQQETLAATVIVTCTTAQKPLLQQGDVSPGTLICAMGADAAHKCEIAPALMASSRVVVDSLAQCAAFGDLHHAIAAGLMSETDVVATLAGIVSTCAQARRTPSEIVVFDSTGIASQDATAAIAIHNTAVNAGAGLPLELGCAKAGLEAPRSNDVKPRNS